MDPDGDGVKNLLERAFGGNPNLANPYILPKIDDGAPMLSIIYRKAIAASDLSITVEESTDLSSPWDPALGSSSVIEDDGTVQTIRFTRSVEAKDRLFVRVGVTAP